MEWSPRGAGGIDERLRREQRFHDELAAGMQPARMPPRELEPLDDALFAAAGLRPGLRVLELGCGSGDLTIRLVRTGASITALDLSPGMVDVARRRVAVYAEADAEFVVAPVEATGLDMGSFDVILGRFIIHHLDVPRAAAEIRRLLRPGGVAVFAENSGRNPLLMLARTHLAGRFGIPRLGTEDEHPLTLADLEAFRHLFTNVEPQYPVFEFFRLFDRQVLRFRSPGASRLFAGADGRLGRFRRVQPYSFRVVLKLTA